MSIPIITRTNTVDEWRIQTNQEATALNNLETGPYTKSNGTLSLSGNSSLVITANGTALQVSNGALFQSNVAIGKDVSIGQQDTAVGNVTIGGITTIYGPGSGLQVANNAKVNVDLQVTRTIYTGNVATNGNVTIGNDLTVANLVQIASSKQALNINNGYANVKNATVVDLYSTNTSIANAIIDIATVGEAQIAYSNTANANVYNVNIISANVVRSNTILATIETGNVLTLNANVSYTNTGYTTNGIITTATIGNATVTGSANVGTTLRVTGNTTSGNLVTANLTQTGALRTTTRADIGTSLSVGTTATVGNTLTVTGNTTVGNLSTSNTITTGNLNVLYDATVGRFLAAGGTTLQSTVVNGQLSVNGNFVLTGSTVLDTNIFTLRANTPQPYGAGYSYLGVNRGEGTLGSANANSYIRWNEPAKYWDIRDVDNPTSYSKILTANLISDTLNSTSSDTLASSNAANTLNVRIETANTNLKIYTDGLVANTVANTEAMVTANIFNALVSSNNYTDVSVSTANTKLKSYTDTLVSTANTNLKNYVDGNMYAKTGGTISGPVTIASNLTATGEYAYIAGRAEFGDAIITLNSDISQSATPSENAGIEVDRGTAANVRFIWDESLDKWTFTNDGTTYSVVASAAAESYANSAYARANASSQLFNGTSGSATPSSGTLTFSSNNGVVVSGAASTLFLNTPQDLRTTASPAFNTLALTNPLALSQGGTGATSAAGALNNILPSGQVTGYVLATGGPGNYYWTAQTGSGGGGVAPGTTINSSRLSYTANTNGQKTYVTPTFLNNTQLRAYINGVRQFESEYSANVSNSTISFTTSPQNGDNILIEVDGYYINPYYANNITFTAPFGGIVAGANTIQLAIQDIESRKAALSGATFTGDVIGITMNTNASNTSFATTAFVKNVLNSGNTFTHSISGNAGTVTNGVYTSGDQTIGGVKTFSSTISGSINGNAATVTNGVYTTGSYSNPSWITSLAVAKVTGLASSATTDTTNAGNITSGTLNAARLPYTMNQSVASSSSVQFNSLGVGVAATGTSGEIVAFGTITSGYSDDNLKTKLGNIDNALEKLVSLNGFYYEPNQTAQELGYQVKKDVGVSAQEVQRVLPEVITSAPIDDKYLTVRYERLVPLLIEAIKELKAEVDALKGNK